MLILSSHIANENVHTVHNRLAYMFKSFLHVSLHVVTLILLY